MVGKTGAPARAANVVSAATAVLLATLAVVLCLCPAPSTAQIHWIGMTPEPNDARNVSLFRLHRLGKRGEDVARVMLENPGEAVAVDAFRCRPGGTFCLLLTSNGTASWLYNVSVVDGALTSRTTLQGVSAHNLHVDMASGAAYTIVQRPKYAAVARVYAGAVSIIVDLSSYLQSDGVIATGSSTHCSDVQTMWVGIRHAGARDAIVHVDLKQQKIAGHLLLSDPLVTSMWAWCNDATRVNHLGGSTVITTTAKNNTGTNTGTKTRLAAYGLYDNQGRFQPQVTAPIPAHAPEYVMTALLSEPIGYGFFTALYPNNATPGGPPTQGLLGFGNFVPPSQEAMVAATGGAVGAAVPNTKPLNLVPIDFFLTGAAVY